MAEEKGAAAAYIRMAKAMRERANDAKSIGNQGLFEAFAKKVTELEGMAASMLDGGSVGAMA